MDSSNNWAQKTEDRFFARQRLEVLHRIDRAQIRRKRQLVLWPASVLAAGLTLVLILQPGMNRTRVMAPANSVDPWAFSWELSSTTQTDPLLLDEGTFATDSSAEELFPTLWDALDPESLSAQAPLRSSEPAVPQTAS